jgi:3-deoxy-D-manno-octulosonic-acid transferase
MALNLDGSEDAELKIKGIPDIVIGNYQQQDNLNQREDAKEALALATAAATKEEEAVLKAVSKEEKDIPNNNLILSPRPERTKRLPARNRYFLSQEAEEGSPLCLEDPANATTDTKGQDDG